MVTRTHTPAWRIIRVIGLTFAILGIVWGGLRFAGEVADYRETQPLSRNDVGDIVGSNLTPTTRDEVVAALNGVLAELPPPLGTGTPTQPVTLTSTTVTTNTDDGEYVILYPDGAYGIVQSSTGTDPATAVSTRMPVAAFLCPADGKECWQATIPLAGQTCETEDGEEWCTPNPQRQTWTRTQALKFENFALLEPDLIPADVRAYRNTDGTLLVWVVDNLDGTVTHTMMKRGGYNLIAGLTQDVYADKDSYLDDTTENVTGTLLQVLKVDPTLYPDGYPELIVPRSADDQIQLPNSYIP